MSPADNDRFRSPNFGFLSSHDEVLVRHAALAERYVFSDPNSALIKLRQFAELLAQHAAAYQGIAVGPEESQLATLDKLYSAGLLTPKTSELFHGLRKSGNQATHYHANDQRVALHQLRMARELAVWFHRSFGKQPGFKAGPFVPPPNPRDAQQATLDELQRLRDQLAQTQQQIEGAQQSAQLESELRAEAETRAQTAYEELEAALSLAEETEQELADERSRYEERLQELQTESAAAPPEELVATAQEARAAGEDVIIDEAATRSIIDAQLREAGWEVDTAELTYGAGARPVKGKARAIAEWPTTHGPADYVLFVGLKPVAVVEAKRRDVDVAGSVEQSKRYSRGYKLAEGQESPGGPWGDLNLPFLFATNGRPFLRQLLEKSGIWFLDARQPTNHPRALESWYTPEGLTQLLGQDIAAADDRLDAEPSDYLQMRDYQHQAFAAVEKAVAEGRRDMLLAMATGTGKTRTAIGMAYRFVKAKRFRRILFLVDRTALGNQAAEAFKDVRLENYQTFADIYDVKELGDLKPDADTRLQFATVQGMVKRLLYADETAPPVPVDWYDCIIIDECHRGYNLDQEMSDGELAFRSEEDYVSKYRRVIDHFDAVRIGLTATPALHTTEIFGPPVFEYTYRQAVIDGFLVDHEPPFRLITRLAEEGMHWDRGEQLELFENPGQPPQRYNTPDEVDIEIDQFNTHVITENFNRTVCQALAEQIDPSLPGKTMIFCATDSHADMVVRLLTAALEEVYGPIDDNTVLKITGKSDKTDELIRRYKNEQLPKVAVTVDLLTTGIDVPPICNIVFLRRIKSRILFEQMLGRATRLCPDLHGPGDSKDRFLIFDAVDIYRDLQEVSDMKPVVTKPNITFEQLIEELIELEDDDFRAVAKDQFTAKLQRKRLSDSQEELLQTLTGKDQQQLIDHVRKAAPTDLASWLADQPSLGAILDNRQRRPRPMIVSHHEDELRRVERGYGEATRPEDYLQSFRTYLNEHADELPALVVVTQRPRDLTRAQLKELRLALDAAGFSKTNLQTAFRETTNQDIAASIIGYIRHIVSGEPLVPHSQRVSKAITTILASRDWTAPQRKWLERIGKQLEQEVVVDRDALNSGEFKAQGGFGRLDKIFKGQLDAILREIAEEMWRAAA